MKRFTSAVFVILCLALSLAALGCREKLQPGSTANTPTTAASPMPPAAASPNASPAPSITLPAAGQVPLNAIPERLRRPLTLEEINALPPETRDMILRAQGRLPASPAPAPTKK